MSRAPVTTTLEPVVSHCDNRGFDSDPYGFVYFEDTVASVNFDGQDVRMGYMSGAYDPEAESAVERIHDTLRYKPYVFTGNWGEPTYAHIIQAWDFCVANGLPGFREYHEVTDGQLIRWMNGSEFILADRTTLEFAAIRERQAALRARRRRTRG